MRKALFLDRDGVLIKDNHLITTMAEVEINPAAPPLISRFRQAGYLVFIVTNQTVVARGLLTLSAAELLNQQILQAILATDPFAIVEKTYICPHHPNAQVKEFRIICSCRKPKSGMLEMAKNDYALDLSQSILIGDRPTDIYAGRAVGAYAILLSSKIAEEKLIESDINYNEDFLKPNLVVNSLNEVFPR